MSTLVLQNTVWLEKDGTRIMRGLRKRDTSLLDRLIELYQHRLLRYLYYLTGNRELAEDMFQETWMRVLERGHQYNGKSRFDTWLFAIARHLVIDNSRKKSAVSLEAMTEPQDGRVPVEFATAERSPCDHAIRSQTAGRLGQALMHLENVQREVIVLRFQEEMSLDEIADVTDAPLSTVKSRLYRGLEALKPVIGQPQEFHMQSTSREGRN